MTSLAQKNSLLIPAGLNFFVERMVAFCYNNDLRSYMLHYHDD